MLIIKKLFILFALFAIVWGQLCYSQVPSEELTEQQANTTNSKPFIFQSEISPGEIIIRAETAPDCYIYADAKVTVKDSENHELKLLSSPKIETYNNPELGELKILLRSANKEWIFERGKSSPPYQADIDFMGCRSGKAGEPSLCFPPENIVATFSANNSDLSTTSDKVNPPITSATTQVDLYDFNVINTAAGVLDQEEFLTFLESNSQLNSSTASLASMNIFLAVLLVVLGGFMLNLTPCVLPLIPVNLAIMGAGSKSNNRRQGFIRGYIYGSAIAITYGILGVIAALGFAGFGALNSLPSFNFINAAIFVVLALAMFDIFHIDFTRWSGNMNFSQASKGSFVAIFFMGVVTALLAGSCVAPVVIAVLFWSVDLYNSGNYAGLLLPFLLGIGMALPWPFVGGGIASLPKPGRFMIYIKRSFAVIILLLAGYYAYVGWSLLPDKNASSPSAEMQKLREAADLAAKDGKLLFIDFWASWCKNCAYMEKTTFQESKVKTELSNFHVVKLQVEDLNAPEFAEILDICKVKGLPAYATIKVVQPMK